MSYHENSGLNCKHGTLQKDTEEKLIYIWIFKWNK